MNDRDPINSPETIYPSRVDAWIALLLLLTPVLAFGIAIYLWMEGEREDAAIVLGTGIFTGLLTAAFAVPCRYTVTPKVLKIRCGIIFIRVPRDQIRSVEKSRTLRSGLALSLHRVLVKTDRRTYILSPQERDKFIEHLS